MKDYAHTNTQEGRQGLVTWFDNLLMSAGLSPNIRCFTIYQSSYKFDLSETRLPISHSRLLSIIS